MKAPSKEKKIHLDFCKRVLNVKHTTNIVMVYYELGRLPLVVIQRLECLNIG